MRFFGQPQCRNALFPDFGTTCFENALYSRSGNLSLQRVCELSQLSSLKVLAKISHIFVKRFTQWNNNSMSPKKGKLSSRVSRFAHFAGGSLVLSS
jgi:hypothetical protein